MTNQPLLNPDALEAAYEAVDHPAVTRDDMEDIVSDAVSAYLAAALPEVTSVEELHQLPHLTTVLDGAGVVRTLIGTRCGDMMWADVYGEDGVIELPARVLYRPEVTTMAERLKVRRIAGQYWAWCVMTPQGRIIPKEGWLARFHEFEHAIAWADHHARTTKNGDAA